MQSMYPMHAAKQSCKTFAKLSERPSYNMFNIYTERNVNEKGGGGGGARGESGQSC